MWTAEATLRGGASPYTADLPQKSNLNTDRAPDQAAPPVSEVMLGAGASPHQDHTSHAGGLPHGSWPSSSTSDP